MSTGDDAAVLAEAYRDALEAADLDAISALLDPLVRWGPLEDPDVGCHNRNDALRFYRQGKAANARAEVTELTINANRMLVCLRVTGLGGSDAPVDVWQVVTVRDRRIVDISGCETREAGAHAVGVA
jgi:hypothetical protein